MTLIWIELMLDCVQVFGFAQVMTVFAQLSSGFGKSMQLLDPSQLQGIQKVCRSFLSTGEKLNSICSCRLGTPVTSFSCSP
jgi:hypothetical protein